MGESFDLTAVDQLSVGTVGEPGHRVFYIQAREGSQLVTLKVEKQQIAALAQYLGNVLADLPAPGKLPEDLHFEEPAIAEWIVGPIGISYDQETDRILLLCEELVFDDDTQEGDALTSIEDFLESTAEQEGAVARFAITREQAAAVAILGARLVESGRPLCPLCGHPLEPSGHACPRTNGHRPPAV